MNVVKELIQRYNAKVTMITSWQMNGTESRRRWIQHQFGEYELVTNNLIMVLKK